MAKSVDHIQLCRDSEVTADSPRTFSVEGTEIVVFRVGSNLFALENLCPHQHLAAFHRGHLDGFTVTCPMHGWSFDVRTGLAVAGSGRLRPFRLHLNNGIVFIDRDQLFVDQSNNRW